MSDSNNNLGCGCCLYGPYTILPAVLFACAMATSWIVTFDCRFFASTEKIQNHKDFSYTVGPWLVEQWSVTGGDLDYKPGQGWNLLLSWDTGDCVWWTDHNVLRTDMFDWPVTTTRAVTMFTAAVSIILAVIHLFTFCFTYPRIFIWCLSGFYVLVACIFGVSLVFPLTKFCKDAQHCSLRTDAYIAFTSIGLWLFTALTTIFLPVPKRWVTEKSSDRNNIGETRETVEEEEQEDGTIIIITTVTTIFKNGDEKVIETRELKTATGVSPVKASSIMVSSTKSSAIASSEEEGEGEEDEEQAPTTGDEEQTPKTGEGEIPSEDEGNTRKKAAA